MGSGASRDVATVFARKHCTANSNTASSAVPGLPQRRRPARCHSAILASTMTALAETSTPAQAHRARVARRVLEIEARAVATLSARLDESFRARVEIILACTGRVVVSGIGKSGHIARKIASTLASTGTPAFFVHPAEASHGDLGMITARGRLDRAVEFRRERRAAGDRAAGQAPGRQADRDDRQSATRPSRARPTSIWTPASREEACPLRLAPTASTTAALALGDALAVALLEARGFGAEDFARSHPGGSARPAAAHPRARRHAHRRGHSARAAIRVAVRGHARDVAQGHGHDRGARRRRTRRRHLHRRRPAPHAGESRSTCAQLECRQVMTAQPAHHPARPARRGSGQAHGRHTRSTSCWWWTTTSAWSARSTCTTCFGRRSSEHAVSRCRLGGTLTVNKRLIARARRIRLAIFDVDGVLTDGTLYLGEHGEEMKAFNIHDGLGIKMLRASGVELAIIRPQLPRVALRAKEPRHRHLYSRAWTDKLAAFEQPAAQARPAPKRNVVHGRRPARPAGAAPLRAGVQRARRARRSCAATRTMSPATRAATARCAKRASSSCARRARWKPSWRPTCDERPTGRLVSAAPAGRCWRR